jgi:N-methylhydantoinase A
MSTRLAIDIGGTFTDLVALDEATGEVTLEKALTTPANFADGVTDTMGKAGLDAGDVAQFVHGTTVVINALTERRGAVVALVTTEGFRDVLEIQRANRTDMYNLMYEKPRPFVPRRFRFEVPERVTHRGEVLTPLDEEAVRRVAERCRAEGVEAIAVCFLNAYANPDHEARAREIIERVHPDAAVTASYEITQQWREYERTNTTALNAFVKPATALYLSTLDRRLSEMGFSGSKLAMQSNGGTTTFRQAERVPIHLVESGPVGGVIGARVVAAKVGEENIISFDMGGTTAKVSLIEGGEIRINTEYHLEKSATWAGYPLRIPVADIVEVGAGGGSIAWIDAGGALHVGPRSAGADPGPACYDLGGSDPTVTDANLVTGRLSADYFLGGRMRLDAEKAGRAVATVADAVGLSVTETALGVLRLANANMQAALERVSVERGYDPRDFALVAAGGAGGLHAPMLARELRMRKVIVPRAPGQFSAWGMLMTDLRHDVIRTHVMPCDQESLGEIRETFRDLERATTAQFEEESFPASRVSMERLLDLRYRGQEHTVRTPVAPSGLDGALETVLEAFHRLHEQAYAFRQDDPVEIVNFHVVGWGAVDHPSVAAREADGRGLSAAEKGERTVVFEDAGAVPSRVFERDLLPVGEPIAGPAVVEEPACTTIVCPDQRAVVDRFGNLVITEVAP